jgi:hypothetical protein
MVYVAVLSVAQITNYLNETEERRFEIILRSETGSFSRRAQQHLVSQSVISAFSCRTDVELITICSDVGQQVGHFFVSDSVACVSTACLGWVSKYKHLQIVYLPPNLTDYKTEKNTE